jgi:hypothetical protein
MDKGIVPKKPNPAVLIGGVVLILLICGITGYFLMGSGDQYYYYIDFDKTYVPSNLSDFKTKFKDDVKTLLNDDDVEIEDITILDDSVLKNKDNNYALYFKINDGDYLDKKVTDNIYSYRPFQTSDMKVDTINSHEGPSSSSDCGDYDATKCGSGQSKRDNPSTFICAGDNCVKEECCVDGTPTDVTCTRPSTTGYDFSGVTENLSAPFSATGITCGAGYTGDVTSSKCNTSGTPYHVTGCSPNANTRVDCVLGAEIDPADCNTECHRLTQTIATSASGGGTACGTPGIHDCLPGDGACGAGAGGDQGQATCRNFDCPGAGSPNTLRADLESFECATSTCTVSECCNVPPLPDTTVNCTGGLPPEVTQANYNILGDCNNVIPGEGCNLDCKNGSVRNNFRCPTGNTTLGTKLQSPGFNDGSCTAASLDGDCSINFGALTNGNLGSLCSGDNIAHDSSCDMTCNDGFFLTAQPTCTNGVITPATATCTACNRPTNAEPTALLNCTDATDSTATSCQNGWTGDSCNNPQGDGSTPPTPPPPADTTAADCTVTGLTLPLNGAFDAACVDEGTLADGSSCTLTCNDGYTISGTQPSCSNGVFSPGTITCNAHEPCAAGSYVSTPGTGTEDAVCATCSPVVGASGVATYTCTSADDSRVSACAAGNFKTVGAAGLADTCNAHSLCTPGMEVSTVGTATDDTVCTPVVCRRPTDITGYTVTETQLNSVGFNVVAACDTGYMPTGDGPVATTCGDTSGYYALTGCAIEDPCSTIDCGTNGSCLGGTCTCTGGYTGDLCQNAPTPAPAPNTYSVTANAVCVTTQGATPDDIFSGTPEEAQSACDLIPACQGFTRYGNSENSGNVLSSSITGTQQSTLGSCYQKTPAPVVCRRPTDITGYTVTETQLNSVGFNVDAACDTGYMPTGDGPVATTCGDASGYYALTGCAIEDPCSTIDCGDHGSCSGGTCSCTGGYTGLNCETAPPAPTPPTPPTPPSPPPVTNLCANVHCGSHGSCNTTTGNCVCRDNYSGPQCQDSCEDVRSDCELGCYNESPSDEDYYNCVAAYCGNCFANIGESCGKQNNDNNNNLKNLLNMNNTHKNLLFVLLLIIVIFLLFKDKM